MTTPMQTQNLDWTETTGVSSVPVTPAPTRRLRRYVGRAYLALLTVVVLVILLAGVLPFKDPNAQDLAATLLPPFWQEGGSLSHPLGTDQLGQDMLSRIVVGARLTLLLALAATVIAAIVGSLVGLIAGYKRGVTDWVISRLVDTQLALPFLLLAMALVAAAGRSILVLLVVMGAIAWAQFARMVRAEVLSLREQPFVLALRTAGVPTWRIVLRHLLPNVMPTIGVVAALQIGTMILVESALSFLGLGVAAPQFTWGSMLADGKDLIGEAWWISAIPGLMITLAVLHITVAGDLLRTRLDPRMKQR